MPTKAMNLLFEQRQKNSSFEQEFGHHLGNVGQSQTEESTPIPPSGTTGTTTMRTPPPPKKYLVLLQDCLAIKFVPLVPSTNTKSTFATTTNIPFNTNRSNGNNQTLNYTLDHRQLQKSSAGLHSSSTLFADVPTSNPIDHSLHGVFLFKGFREANLKCHWNLALYEAFHGLEYRGYILPSILLLWAIPRFLSTLRTAWSRQMLRSPPGFRIEFIGEIEELIADPIQQSQFAPLSDSLCWAILEITSLGQEAFVDSILRALSNAFPKMVQPNRELVYTTLEKLTRERKVYQTSNGYFVVTPDTFRYMVSSNSQQGDTIYGNTLDTLLTQPHDPEKESLSHHSWDSTNSAENSTSSQRPPRSFGDEEPFSDERDHRLRRHNSLKIIRQKDNPGGSKGLGTRSLSFRLYKSKSVYNTTEDLGKGTENDKLATQMEKLLKAEESPTKPSRRNSLSRTALDKFRKLFRKSTSKQSIKKSNEGLVLKSSTSTQTPAFTDKTKPNGSQKPSPDRIIIARPTIVEPEQNSTFGHFTLPYENKDRNHCWNSLPPRQRERPSSRHSNIGDDHSSHHLYATPTSPDNFTNNNGGQPQPHTLIGFPYPRGESSRCSTLSQGTSLGYGSQGQGTSLQGFTSQSPSPSSASNLCPEDKGTTSPPNLTTSRNCRNYYDYYNKRRYPTYTYAGPNTKPISHYEVIKNSNNNKPEGNGIEIKKNSNGLSNVSTTTTMNSTTNMEVELMVPLGKILNGRKLQNGKSMMSANGGAITPLKTKISVGNPQNSTEVKTTVNQNGRIETHFDCDSGDEGKSRMQIKVTKPRNVDLVLVNGENGCEGIVADQK